MLLGEFVQFAQQVLLEIVALHVRQVIIIIQMLQPVELAKLSVPSAQHVTLLEQLALLARLAMLNHSVLLAKLVITCLQIVQLPARFARIQTLIV